MPLFYAFRWFSPPLPRVSSLASWLLSSKPLPKPHLFRKSLETPAFSQAKRRYLRFLARFSSEIRRTARVFLPKTRDEPLSSAFRSKGRDLPGKACTKGRNTRFYRVLAEFSTVSKLSSLRKRAFRWRTAG